MPDPDALSRAAERWGSARIDWRRAADAPWTVRMVASRRCFVCNARVAYDRFRAHLADHLKAKA